MESGECQRLGVGLDLPGVHRQRIVAETWICCGTARGSHVLCVCSDSAVGFGDSSGGADLGLIGNCEEEEEEEECLDGRKIVKFHFFFIFFLFGSGSRSVGMMNMKIWRRMGSRFMGGFGNKISWFPQTGKCVMNFGVNFVYLGRC